MEWLLYKDGTSSTGEVHDLVTGFVGVSLLFAFGLGALAASCGVVTDGRTRTIRWFAPLVVAIGVVVTLATRAAWTSASCEWIGDRHEVVRRGAPAYFEIHEHDGDGPSERRISLLVAFGDCVFWTGVASVIVALPIAGRSLVSRT